MPGLLQKNKHGVAPVDFIMYGKIRGVEYGLSFLRRYHVIPPQVLSSKNFALPMVRKRVFIVLRLREVMTLYKDLELPRVFDALSSLNPRERLSIDACLMDDRSAQWSS